MYEGQKYAATGTATESNSRHVPQSLGTLDAQIDNCFNLVENLEKLLGSVLAGPSEPTCDSRNNQVAPSRAGLAETIQSQANRIASVNERLRDISGRIQL
jgi:hypothetical protein